MPKPTSLSYKLFVVAEFVFTPLHLTIHFQQNNIYELKNRPSSQIQININLSRVGTCDVAIRLDDKIMIENEKWQAHN